MTYQLLQGDCIEVLKTLPAGCVHTCVTSPPYFGLRSYGIGTENGEIGLEPTPDQYVAKMVAVFREVKRVLRNDGTLFLNLGDSYGTGVGANITDLLKQRIKEGVIFLGAGCALTVAAKGNSVLENDKLAPDCIFTSLLGVKRVFVKEGNKDLCQIFDSLTSIGSVRIGSMVSWVAVGEANSDIILDVVNDVTIVVSENYLNAQPSFKIPIGAGTAENGQASFAVKEAAKPVAELVSNGQANGHTFTLYTVGEGFTQVDPIHQAVTFGDTLVSNTKGICDLCVTTASQEKFSLSLMGGRCQIAFVSIAHVFVSDEYGSLIRYSSLYDQAQRKSNTLKAKQELGIPDMVKRALMEDGWICRSTIIWHKPNPMPESVTDRPTKSHEYLFLLTKSERYYYDSEAIKEPSITNDMRRPYGSEGAWQLDGRPAEQRHGGELRVSRSKTFARSNAVSEHVIPGQSAAQHRPERTDVIDSTTRNKRSVWTVATRPYKEAHFATYPVELIQPCILAGTSSHGCCAACGAPWIRTLERTKAAYTPCNGAYTEQHIQQSKGKTRSQAGGTPIDDVVTVGWGPSCNCMSADTYACTVLDPFNGSGTTGAVAINLGRQYIGIDINPDYIELAHKRIGNTQPALLGGAL